MDHPDLTASNVLGNSIGLLRLKTSKRHNNTQSKIVSEEQIPKSQTADKSMDREEEPHNIHETPGRQTKQSIQLSIPNRDDCKTRMDTK